jgi:hypothetical protein
MTTFNKPNLSAPRFKKKRETMLNGKFYQELKNKYQECKNLDKKEIRNIIETFNKEIVETIITDRNGFELPEGLGYLFIGAVKIKKKKVVDYKNSLKHGVLITHKNWNTDGYVGKIVYTNYKAKYRFKNAQIWGFKAARTFSRYMSKEFTKRWNTYKVLIENVREPVYKK